MGLDEGKWIKFPFLSQPQSVLTTLCNLSFMVLKTKKAIPPKTKFDIRVLFSSPP